MASVPFVDRRTFIEQCAGAALGIALGGCASLAVREVTPVGGKITLALQQYPDLTRPGGWLKLLPSGSTEQVYVLALDDGDLIALSPICTHLGCTVDVQGSVLLCPCHGSMYDRSGQVLRGPAARALRQYDVVRSNDGTVTIDLLSS